MTALAIPHPGRIVAAAGERLVLPAALLLGWQLVANASPSPFFPPPVSIVQRARETWLASDPARLWLSEAAVADLLPSLGRLLAGFVLAVALGVLGGVALGLLPRTVPYVAPLLAVARSVPPPAFIGVFLVMFGIGAGSKITLIAFGSIWPVLLNTTDGVRATSRRQLDTCRAFDVGWVRRLIWVVLPSASPKIFAGIRIALAISVIMMVVSEMVASTNGLGFHIVQSQRSFSILDMWAGIIALAVLGATLNGLLHVVEMRLLRWHHGATGRLSPSNRRS